jgi:hypothetical protein
MCALHRSTRCCGSSRRRFLQSLDKLAPRIFTLFELRRIAASDVMNLSRRHFINLQFSIGNPSKAEKPSRKQKINTSVRGCDLLKASMPKFLGTGDFFFNYVMA